MNIFVVDLTASFVTPATSTYNRDQGERKYIN